MPFTTFFTFTEKLSLKRNVKLALTLEDVLSMPESVHVQMRLNKKGELVPHKVEHVTLGDVKASPTPSSVTTLVGSPIFKALSFMPGAKEVQVLPKHEVAEVKTAVVSHPAQLIGAFHGATSGTNVKHEHIASRIRVVRALCSGNFGQVFLVQDTNTRKTHALKVISKGRLDVEQHALIFEEQNILQRLAGNPEFLTLRASFEDRSNFYLLTEYYAGGDLFDQIVQKGRIPEPEAKPMVAQL
ncbi:kinase-like protein, partial [Lentinus brumalis]